MYAPKDSCRSSSPGKNSISSARTRAIVQLSNLNLYFLPFKGKYEAHGGFEDCTSRRLVIVTVTLRDIDSSNHTYVCEGVKVKTLEHRLKVVSQEELILQSKLLTAESAVLKKEKELLAAMDARLGAAESRNPSQVELIEYVETSDKFRALQV